MEYIISFLISVPLVGSLLLFFLPMPEKFIKKLGFFFSLFTFFISLLLLLFFDSSTSSFQFVEVFCLFSHLTYTVSFGVDGISLFFIILTTFLVPLCLLSAWGFDSSFNTVSFFGAFLLIEAFILVVFLSLDLLVFYIFFESTLIPIYLIIGSWGSRERKVRAGFLLFIYTLFGSLFMLVAIVFIFFESGSLDYGVLLETPFSFSRQKLIWFAFFVSFASKVPIVPVHIWLPEAHVEAPTAGSVILAGILLKLGSYGFFRFSLPLFPLGSLFFRPFVFLVATVGVLYTSITALRQVDIKRVVAYASVAHINITLLGLFSFNVPGLEGSLFQIISHGLVSGALFFCIGVLYDRHHSRLVKYYSGLAHTIPLFAVFFLFFTIANIALPGTSSFVGELLILIGLFSSNSSVCFISGISMVLGGGYSLWLFNRIFYGNSKTQYIIFSLDLNKREFITLFPLLFFVVFLGFCPNFFFDIAHFSCCNLIKQIFNLKW